MEENTETIPTYREMFAEYLGTEKAWIGPGDLPLVHHIKSLCRQLDSAGLDKASLASAYLQAVAQLHKRRPGARPPVPGDLPGQGSIFDELD